MRYHIWMSLWVRDVSGIIVVSPRRLCCLKTLTRRALSRRVIMLAGACLARSCLARRALDTNFSFNWGWYFEYFSKSEHSQQMVPVRNLYSKILRICWFQGKSNWTFSFWEIQWLHPVHEEKNFDEILIFWSFIFECLYGSGVSQGSSWWVPGGSAILKHWLVELCLEE